MQHNLHYPKPPENKLWYRTDCFFYFGVTSIFKFYSVPSDWYQQGCLIIYLFFLQKRRVQVFISFALPLSPLHSVVINFNLK